MNKAYEGARKGRQGSMKREDVEKFFPDATAEQVDGILNRIGSELNPLKQSVEELAAGRDEALARLAKAEGEAAAYKGKADELAAQVQSGMSAEERLEQLQKESEQQRRDYLLKSNALDARAILLDGGIPAEQCEALVEQVVSDDPEKTKALAQSIVGVAKAQKDAAEQATKAALLQQNPKLGGAGDPPAPAGPKTMKEFLALPYEKQLQLKAADPDVMSKLTKE